jgi:pimeloyl-ACP methyl ester carboxylesterase
MSRRYRHSMKKKACMRTVSLLAAMALSCLAAPALAATERCRIDGLERELQCGTVAMPENPDAPAGRRIDIGYAVVPAIARSFPLEPVFVIAGGPGQAATKVAGRTMPLFQRLNARRDIVFVDQRGTGRSNALACKPPPAGAPLQRLSDPSVVADEIEQCLAELAASRSADLAQYATWIAMRDLDAVREKLGYAQINLWGASYGTRAALEYLRQFPARVRSVVLDGAAPADMVLPASFPVDADAALKKLSAACAADARCASTWPQLDASIDRLLARAAAAPLRGQVAHPLTGALETIELNPELLRALLRTPMYAPQIAALLPFALAQAERGDFGALMTMSVALSDGMSDNLAIVMHLAVICAEDLPRVDEAAVVRATATRFGAGFIDLYRRACKPIARRAVPPEFYSVSDADVPVLILSGGADPATPPRHGEALAKKLRRATHFVAPHLGHGVSMQGCAPDLVTRFVRQGHADGLKGECLARLPAPLPFLPPGAEPRR